MSEVSRWYPTKVDTWLAVVLAIAPLGSAIAAIAVMASPRSGGEIALLAPALLAAIYLGLVFPMRYGMSSEALGVRHGLVRQRIPLRAITEVNPTRNPLSSPALSLDRLEIKFGEGFFRSALISPRDRHEFLDELAAKAGLTRNGDRLARGPS